MLLLRSVLAAVMSGVTPAVATGFRCPDAFDPSLATRYEAEGWEVIPSRSGISQEAGKTRAYLEGFSLYQRGSHVLPRFVEEDADLVGTWATRGDGWTAGCRYHINRLDFITMYCTLAGEAGCRSFGHAGDTTPGLAMHANCR